MAIPTQQQATPCRATTQQPQLGRALKPYREKTTAVILPRGGKNEKLRVLGVEMKQHTQPKTSQGQLVCSKTQIMANLDILSQAPICPTSKSSGNLAEAKGSQLREAAD